jgi:hypothetical protein
VINPDFLDHDIFSEDFKDTLAIFDYVDVLGTQIRKKNYGKC